MTSEASQPRPMRVFLSHASDDKPAVRELAAYLRSAGIDVWLDEDKILPGQDWKTEIAAAVRNSDAIIVCLSQKTASKEGYIQREIRLALDVAEEKPEGTIFVIPVRLENSIVPERLSRWQWVDLFPGSGAGREKLGEALVRRARTMGSVSVPTPNATGEASNSPDFKYFYYVSRPKLDLLAAQFGLGAATAPTGAVRDVHAITAALESRGLVKELEKEQDVDWPILQFERFVASGTVLLQSRVVRPTENVTDRRYVRSLENARRFSVALDRLAGTYSW